MLYLGMTRLQSFGFNLKRSKRIGVLQGIGGNMGNQFTKTDFFFTDTGTGTKRSNDHDTDDFLLEDDRQYNNRIESFQVEMLTNRF